MKQYVVGVPFTTTKKRNGKSITVESKILARTKAGELIIHNELPGGLFCLIFCKANTMEAEIETMLDNCLKRRV